MIRVAMTLELSQPRNDATSYFTFSSIYRHWELFFQNRSRELFLSIATSIFLKFKRNLQERYRDIWGSSFYGQKYGKKWTILMFGRYLKKTKRFWHAISHHNSSSLFKNMCERSWRQLQHVLRSSCQRLCKHVGLV